MHTDPELLSLIALGEHAGTEGERVHAETCPECAGELSALLRVVTLGRSVSPDTRLTAPRHDVWARIRDELALGFTAGPPPGPTVVLPPVTPAPGAPADELQAKAMLSPVDRLWSDASGEAELATDGYGRRLLQVALHADLPRAGIRQAWLVHRDNPELRQSLGVLDGPHGLWTVAHSIDLEQYAILDISQQGLGEVGHSGQTIVRGELALVS